MADEKPIDPAAIFQDWVTQWERSVDRFSNQMMATDEFSKSMNQMQNVQLEFQRTFGEYMARQLTNLNMPSRDDVLQISEDIRALDRRMLHIETTLRKLIPAGDNGPGAKPKSPPRTKRPPAKSKKEN